VRILVVEDERELSEVLLTLLQHNEYDADAVYDGVSGEDYALSGIYDLVLLDIMLPRKDGVEVLRSLRKRGNSTPVLLLTAKSEVEDKIKGLDAGADDYLTKPFASGELLARIRAMTRRKGEYVSDTLTLAGTTLDGNTHVLSCASNKVKLSIKEYQMLELLMLNSRQIIPKERFFEKIWGYDSSAEYNAVEVYISFIRKKLAAIDSRIQITAVRGSGYSLMDST
jgi:DNA-binding response OmpR family regulator